MEFSIFKPTSRASISLYLALRGLQVGSCSIVGFLVCWMISQHREWHYCDHVETCTAWQMMQTEVPAVYIWLLTCICSWITASFVLGYKQLSFVMTEITAITEPEGKIRLPIDDSVDSSPPNNQIWDPKDEYPFNQCLRNAFKSLPNTSLIIDTVLLVISSLSFHVYTRDIIWGRALPFCSWDQIWMGSTRGIGTTWGPQHGETPRSRAENFWKSMRVIDSNCLLSQCLWVTFLFVFAFTVLITILEVAYLRAEWKIKGRDVKVEERLLKAEEFPKEEK